MKNFWKNVHILTNEISKKYPNSICSVHHVIFMIGDGEIFEWYNVSLTNFDNKSDNVFKLQIETQDKVITILKSI